MFDSFDQEEKRLVDQLAASEQSSKKLSTMKSLSKPSLASNSKFTQKVNMKEFQAGRTTKANYVAMNK